MKKINILKNGIVKLKQGVKCSGVLAKQAKMGFLELNWQKFQGGCCECSYEHGKDEQLIGQTD